jgi:hypothetical protein
MMRVNKNYIVYTLASLDMLISKYNRGLGDKIMKLLPTKFYQGNFAIGYRHFENEEYGPARKAFREALKYDRWHPKAYFYLLLTLVPKKFIRFLRIAKRKLLPGASRPKWTRWTICDTVSTVWLIYLKSG